MKSLMKLALLATLILPALSAAQTYHLDRYPSRITAKKLLAKNAKRIIIGDRLPNNASLGYPSTMHVRNMALLKNAAISIRILTTAYPSRANSLNLNRLGGNTDLYIELQNCLTSPAELKRLQSVTKKARILIGCWGKNTIKKARPLVEKLKTTNPNLDIILVSNR